MERISNLDDYRTIQKFANEFTNEKFLESYAKWKSKIEEYQNTITSIPNYPKHKLSQLYFLLEFAREEYDNLKKDEQFAIEEMILEMLEEIVDGYEIEDVSEKYQNYSIKEDDSNNIGKKLIDECLECCKKEDYINALACATLLTLK